MLSAMRHHSHDSTKRSFIYYYSRDAEDESLKKNGARDAEEAEEARYIFSREEKIGGSIILYHRFIISYNNFLDFVGLDYYLYPSKERKERLLFEIDDYSSSSFFFRAHLAPKSIKFVHGRLPKARQTRHARVEIELKSNGRRINESTNRCIRNAITEYKTSECFSRRINSFFPRIFIVSSSTRNKIKIKK